MALPLYLQNIIQEAAKQKTAKQTTIKPQSSTTGMVVDMIRKFAKEQPPSPSIPAIKPFTTLPASGMANRFFGLKTPTETLKVEPPEEKVVEPSFIAPETITPEFQKKKFAESLKTKGIEPILNLNLGMIQSRNIKENWVKEELNKSLAKRGTGYLGNAPYETLRQNYPEEIAQKEKEYEDSLLIPSPTEKRDMIINQIKLNNARVMKETQEQRYAKMTPLEKSVNMVYDKTEPMFQRAVFRAITGMTGIEVPGLYKTYDLPETPEGIAEKVAATGGSLAGFLFGIKGIGTLTEKMLPKVTNTFQVLLKNGADFTILGQAHGFVRNESLTEHLKSIPTSFLEGIIYGGAGMGIKKFTRVLQPLIETGVWTGISKLQGASNEDAVIQGALMGALNVFGYSPEAINRNEIVKRARKILDLKEGEGPEKIVDIYTEKMKGVTPGSIRAQELEGSVIALLYNDKLSAVENMFKEGRLIGLRGITGKKTIHGFEEGVNPADIVKVKKRGSGEIKITREDLEGIKGMNVLDPRSALRKKVEGTKLENIIKIFEDPYRTLDTPQRIFEELGPWAKETFYEKVTDVEHDIVIKKEAMEKAVDDLRTQAKISNEDASRRIMIYALSKEPGGMEIINAHKTNVPELTEPEMKAYEYMREQYDITLDALNKVRRMIGKDSIEKRPDYFTHIRELKALTELGRSLAQDDINALILQGVHRNSPSFGYEKTRTGVANIEFDAFNVFKKYMNQAIRYENITPVVAKLRELTRTKITDPVSNEVFELIKKDPVAYRVIQDWLDTLVNQKKEGLFTKYPGTEKALETLNRNLGVSTLAFNIASALLQPTAIVNTLTEITPTWTLKGVEALMNGEGEMALQKSRKLRGRIFESTVRDVSEFSGNVNDFANAGMKPLKWLDSLTAQATWLGAYKKGLSEKMSETNAIKYADNVVVRTQGSGAKYETADIQRGGVGKMLTLFQTFTINNYGFLKRDVLGIGNKNISHGEVARKIITLVVGSAIINSIYTAAGIPSPLPSPIQAFKEEGLYGSMKELAGLLPIVGGGLRFGKGGFGATAQYTEDIIRKLSGTGYGPQVPFAELVARGIGVPGTSQFVKFLKGKKAIEEGYTVGGKKIKMKGLDKLRAMMFGPYQTKSAQEQRELNRKKK